MVKERLEHIVGTVNPLRWGAKSRLLLRKRLIEPLHLDFWLAVLGFSPYHELNIREKFRFAGDVYEDGVHVAIVMDPEAGNKDTYVRRIVRRVGKDEGRIDETTEWTRDIPEASSDKGRLNLRINIGESGGEQKGSCYVNGYDKSIMDGVIGIPYKLLKNQTHPRRVFVQPKLKAPNVPAWFAKDTPPPKEVPSETRMLNPL